MSKVEAVEAGEALQVQGRGSIGRWLERRQVLKWRGGGGVKAVDEGGGSNLPETGQV